MFGEAPDRAIIRVCCGPRCGVEPGHRAIYAAIEGAATKETEIRPAMCQGLCGEGVTVILPDREKRKVRSVQEARQIMLPPTPENIPAGKS